jgi:hypothetical protein
LPLRRRRERIAQIEKEMLLVIPDAAPVALEPPAGTAEFAYVAAAQAGAPEGRRMLDGKS